MTKQLSEDEKAVILQLSTQKISSRKISKKIKNHNLVWLNSHTNTKTIHLQTGSWRPPKLSKRDKAPIVREALKNRRITRKEIKKNTGIIVHETTIGNVLKEHGFKAQNALHKLLLTENHKTKRLEWAKKYQSWIEVDWEKLLFTDESKIELSPIIVTIRSGKESEWVYTKTALRIL